MARQWPLPAGTYRITSRFAGRTNPVTGRPENHSGTDLAAPDGTPFYAVQSGTVKYIGAASGYGQWIVVDSSDAEGGGCVEYGHMWNAYATGLRVGSRVTVGQKLGYIGSNGQSTGPHLHITVWKRAYGGQRVDPETWLAGCPHPPVGGGVAGGKPVPAAPASGDKAGTIFGVDVSSHQNGLPLSRAKAAGARFAFIKATEGHTYRDPVFHSHLADARTQGLQVAAYLYVWHNSTPAQMADTLAGHVRDTSVPVILDIEENSGSSVAHWKQTVAELRARGYRVPMVYIPRWYWQRVGSPSLAGLPPLWSSAYPAGGGPLADTYRRAGGDTGSGWAGYGGLNVVMWQFTDAANIGWTRGVDGNAFKGGDAGLRALLTGKAQAQEDFMATDRAEALLNEIAAMQRDTLIQLTGSHKVNDFPGFNIGALAKTAREKLAKGKGLTMMETIALNWHEERQTGDQLSGPERDKAQERAFTGWHVADVLNVARRRNYRGLTVAQMLVIGFFGDDADRAAVRAQIEVEESSK